MTPLVLATSLLTVVLAQTAQPVQAQPRSSVVGSKHDLSASGPGPIKATTESRVCVFCHVSHGSAGQALWNRPDPKQEHLPYASSTLKNIAGRPTGTSRMCLSCHDGTIAMGETLRQKITITGGDADGKIPRGRRSNLGTDLRGSHPLSMGYLGGAKLSRPQAGDRVRLDKSGEIQCTSCHDAHSEYGGTAEGKFLVKETRESGLCSSCHRVPATSTHLQSSAPVRAVDATSPATAPMRELGCGACHRSHGGVPGARLLGARDASDAQCTRCHDGSLATDVARDASKPYSHSVDSPRHDAAEAPDRAAQLLPERSAGAPRHAACVDCHDAHEATTRPVPAPGAGGTFAGVWGIDESGRRVDAVRFEYEVCLKCHGDSANKPPPSVGLTAVRRANEERNLRLVFGRTASSAHPVIALGRNPDVPSLKAPLGPGSFVFCTDCHASDSSRAAGGTGARGPHGSRYEFLLERAYSRGDPIPESSIAYALCYKCHDRDVLLSARSSFGSHGRHVVNERTACSTCHSAHGVAANAGSPASHAHLVDFDVSVVAPLRGVREYVSGASRSGSCTLVCHGATHDARRY